MAAQTGHGAALVTNDTFVASIISISGTDQTREMIDTSHLGTTVTMTKVEGDLVDTGEVSIEYLFDPAATTEIPAIATLAGTFTITFPVSVSGNTAGTLAGTGFWTSVGYPELVTGGLMKGSGTFKWTGGAANQPSYTAET